MATLLLCLLQQDLTVPFADPRRAPYVDAIKECRAAQERMAADPEAAERELTAVLKRPGLVLERRVTVYERPNDPNTYNLCPWQYRGQARLALARRPGTPEPERRRRLREAVGDLEKSAAERNPASEPLLREARRELWPLVRAQLRYGAPEPASPEEARRLLAAIEEPAAAAKGLAAEVERVRATCVKAKADLSPRDLRMARARGDLAWADLVDAAVKELAPFRVGAAAVAELSMAAAFQGVFRLKVAVYPFAEKVVLRREGHPVPLPARATPLVVPGFLEAGRFEIEVHHPKWGKRQRAIRPDELKDGKTYVLSGDLEKGAFELTELP